MEAKKPDFVIAACKERCRSVTPGRRKISGDVLDALAHDHAAIIRMRPVDMLEDLRTPPGNTASCAAYRPEENKEIIAAQRAEHERWEAERAQKKWDAAISKEARKLADLPPLAQGFLLRSLAFAPSTSAAAAHRG